MSYNSRMYAIRKQTLTFFIGMAFLISGCNSERTEASSDEAVLAALLDEFLDGASINDAEMHDRFWAEDLVYTGSSGSRTTKQEIMAGLDTAAGPDDAQRPEYGAEDVQIRVYDDAAVVAFRLTASTAGERTEYFNTGTFLKRDGEWRAVAWQATRIPEE